MPIDPKLLEILTCQACRLAFPVVDDIPNLIAEDAQPLAE